MRPAFTLVELLVAIVILAVGVLALAATAGLVAAHIGDGARLTGAAHVARTVLDSLGGRDCAAITTGASSRDGISTEWTVAGDSDATRVALTVGAPLRRTSRRDTYRLVVPCVRD